MEFSRLWGPSNLRQQAWWWKVSTLKYGAFLKWYPKSSKSFDHFSIKTHGDLGYRQSRTPPYLRIPIPSKLQLVQPFLPLPPIYAIHPQKMGPKIIHRFKAFRSWFEKKLHPGNAENPGLNSGPGTRIVSEHSYESHVPCEARWYSSEFYHDSQFAKCLFARE